YDPLTAANEPGLPAPVVSDVNNRPGRGSLAGLYERIMGDLQEASGLLPLEGASRNRPSKVAAEAMLARVALGMGNYPLALSQAEKVLATHSALIDFNTIRQGVSNPFPEALPKGNVEMLFFSPKLSYVILNTGIVAADPELLSLFAPNDLRGKIYFYSIGGGLIYNRNYEGIAVDELYLIRAECLVRAGDVARGMQVLNSLLVKRYPTGNFVPLQAVGELEALQMVISERRKELFGRGLRWQDLRRLNQDARFAKTLRRSYDGVEYVLPPGDNRYTFPIPDDELAGNPIGQN
ncbi:MAG: RagB/SusD family nutrient uptake outer membrane protein, partial [Chitinophagaceae bacterium]